jgi:hypothetical protein
MPRILQKLTSFRLAVLGTVLFLVQGCIWVHSEKHEDVYHHDDPNHVDPDHH